MSTLTLDSTAAVIAASPSTRAYACPVPPVLEAVGTVRRRAQRVLAAWGTPRDTTDDALLVISELVTNAVIHALPPAELRLSLRRTGSHAVVRIEVSDAGAAPGPGSADSDLPMDEHGRGNAIVLALTARCGTRTPPGEVVRWAELPIG
ncbi:ATP-binding protein [Streptomyces sp. NPDC005474]|uniref:ATP-binding protein n=1 Tax=Streptomyces sp. NPDC005474 TaxID=3154878 RepID=UPI003452FB61